MDDFTRSMSIKIVSEVIASRCNTLEQVQDLLSDLESIENWDELIEARALENNSWPCSFCDQIKDARTFTTIVGRNRAGSSYRRACIECANEINLWAICIVCGSSQLAYCPMGDDFACLQCEGAVKLVEKHNARAEKLSLTADLTAKEWKETLRYFSEECAYCGNRYECLEHYLPLYLNGGTTAKNCIPACNTCNTRKNNLHPNKLSKKFPQERLNRIEAWLEIP